MQVLGMSNRLDSTHSLFFFEFDNIKKEDLVLEVDRLSKYFGIDIFCLKSSENNYHLISFNVLGYEAVKRIQRYISIPSDYTLLDEQKLFGNVYGDNCLRISYKGKEKAIPKYQFSFLKAVQNYKPQIAINHFILYQKLVEIPNWIYANRDGIREIPYTPILVKYHTGIGSRRKRCLN